jgi:hypothetical protein
MVHQGPFSSGAMGDAGPYAVVHAPHGSNPLDLVDQCPEVRISDRHVRFPGELGKPWKACALGKSGPVFDNCPLTPQRFGGNWPALGIENKHIETHDPTTLASR